MFIHLLLIANHKDANWRGNKIERGQTFTSINHLANAISLSEKQIRTSIKRLIKTGEIECRGANNGSLISVINYDTYQNIEQLNGEPKVKQGASTGQAKGKQRATNNNNNKNNNNNNNNKIKYSIEERENIFVQNCKTKIVKRRGGECSSVLFYGEPMVQEFIDCWSEPTQGGQKMRFETEKTFEIGRRLKSWSGRDYKGLFKEYRMKVRQQRMDAVANNVPESEIDPEGLKKFMRTTLAEIGK